MFRCGLKNCRHGFEYSCARCGTHADLTLRRNRSGGTVGRISRTGEKRTCGGPGSIDAVAAEHFESRSRENFQVQPKALVLDVPHIHLKFLVPGYCISTIDLGPSCNSWPDLVTPRLSWGVQIQVLGQQRARADKT